MTIGLAVVERPGMKPYRARKAPAVSLWLEPETGHKGVTVYRTHDEAVSLALVAGALFRYGLTPAVSDGERIWMRKKPDGWERVPYEKQGAIPCVVFRVIE